MEHRDQHWNQMSLRDGLHATHHLPLRDRVDGVDVEQPGFAVVVALVHGVHPQITPPAAGIRFASLGNAHLPRLRVLRAHALAAVDCRVAQVRL